MILLFKILLILFGLLLFGNLLTYSLQYVFLFRPKKLPQNFDFWFPFPFEEVFFEAEGKGRIHGLWMRQPEKVSDKGLILYFHGNAGNLARWGAIYSDFESFGYDMFIMDYRGFGKSRGKKSNRLLHGDAFMVYEKMSRYYEGKTIIIYGRSIGSGFACELAARANPKFLFLETPFSSISDLFYTYYPFLPRWFVFHYRFDNKKKVEQVAGPVYVFHGTRDWIIPLRCAELLKVHLKPKDRFTVIPGAGHHNLSDFPDFVEARRRIFTT